MLTALLRIINRVRAGIDARRLPTMLATFIETRGDPPADRHQRCGDNREALALRRRVAERGEEFVIDAARSRNFVVARPSRPRCCATGDRSGGWRRRYRSCVT